MKNTVHNLKKGTYLFLLLGLFFTNTVSSANRYSVANGDWSATSTWAATSGGASGVSAPVAGDVVVIEGGKTVTISVANAAATSITISSGSTLTVGAFTLTVSGTTTVDGTIIFNSATSQTFTGAVTVNAGGVWNETAAVVPTFSSTLTNNGTFTASTGVHTLKGNPSGVITIPNVTMPNNLTITGTFTVTGSLLGVTRDLTNTSGSTINLFGSARLANLYNVSGGIVNLYGTDITNPTGPIDAATNPAGALLNIYGASVPIANNLTCNGATNTVNYAGSGAQAIKNTTYNNLTTSGSGIKTWDIPSGNPVISGNLLVDTGTTLTFGGSSGGSFTVTGTTTVNGTFSSSAGSGSGITSKIFTGAVTVASGGVWNMTADNKPITFAGGITSNGTSFNNGTGATTFSTNDQSLSGSTSMTFGGAVTLGTSGKTLTNNNTGTVTIGGTLTLTGNFTQGVNSTLALAAAATPFSGAGTFNASTNLNTVNYSGAAQTVKAVTYSNLTLSGSGIKTFGSTAIAIANTLTINSGVQANLLAGGNHTTTSLVLNGVGQLPGKSYGGTTSSANVINSTYFTATTGIVNCTCPTYSLTGPNTATTICASVGTSTVTIKSTAVGKLPLGTTYTVTYNTSSPSQTGLTASMTVSPAGTGTFSATGLTTSGSSTVTVTNIANGTCSTAISANNTATVTVNDVPTIAAISAPAALCTGASLNPTAPTVTANGSTVTASGWQLETGVGTGSFANQTMPYTVAFADNGKKIRYYATNGCGTTNGNQVVVTVSAIPTAPVVGTIVQPDCVSTTGSVVLSGLPAGSWTINPGSISGSTASTTVSGLVAATTYNFTVANATGCTSPASANVVINAVPGNKTWNGTVWSPVGSPTAVDPVILAGDYNTTTNGDLIACSITINATKKLTITASTFVTIQNDLIINGTLEVLDKGSLVMVNNSGTVTNNGTTTVNRTTTPFEKFDYTYWSTPVTSTDIPSTFTTWRTDRAYEFLPANFLDANLDGFDDNGDDWLYANTMLPGKGYAIMGPTGGTFPATENVVFDGLLNTGTIGASVGLTPGGATDDDWNLIGNPYPCAISADDFINANISGTGTINQTIGGTLYFWTHKADISANFPGLEAYNFSSADYAMYNLMGGVGTAATTSTTGSNNAAVNSLPLGYIASCQGFFVEAEAAGSVTFNNSMRVNSPSTANTQFYRTANSNKTQKTNVSSKDRIWLNMENNSGLFSQQLVGYLPNNTTLGFDNGYDGLLNDAGNDINFYSFIDKDTYKIQGRSSFDQNDQVKLGYSSVVAGTFNIRIDSKDGVFANTNQAVFLEDKLTNTFFDLKSGNYTFNTTAGTFNDRFVLRYTNNKESQTLSVDETNTNDGIVVLYSNNYKTLIISYNGQDATVNSVSLFNMSGQKINSWDVKDSEQTNIQIPIKNISSEIYVVKVKTTKGETSKKIVIR